MFLWLLRMDDPHEFLMRLPGAEQMQPSRDNNSVAASYGRGRALNKRSNDGLDVVSFHSYSPTQVAQPSYLPYN